MKFNSPFIQKAYQDWFENDQFKFDEALIDEDIRNFEKLLLNFCGDITYDHNINKDDKTIIHIRWSPNERRLKVHQWNNFDKSDINLIDAPIEIKRAGWLVLGDYLGCLIKFYSSSWRK